MKDTAFIRHDVINPSNSRRHIPCFMPFKLALGSSDLFNIYHFIYIPTSRTSPEVRFYLFGFNLLFTWVGMWHGLIRLWSINLSLMNMYAVGRVQLITSLFLIMLFYLNEFQLPQYGQRVSLSTASRCHTTFQFCFMTEVY